MKQVLLPLVTLGLLALVLADRLSHALESDAPEPVTQTSSIASPSPQESPSVNRAVPPPQPGNGGTAAALRTPTIERLARLAARQQLSREAGMTYLDSLIAGTDSVLRRWPDAASTPLRVHLIEGGPAGYHPRMADIVRQALGRWESAGIGVRFTAALDSSGADILVRWIDFFDFDRAGQTDLTWDRAGRVRKAVILLALRTHTGVVLPDPALLTVAVHEAGHALGLPHSPDTNDVMFPATQTASLSERDRRTAQVLYQLPPGSLRDLSGTP